MYAVKQSTTNRLPVKLINPNTGAPLVGIGYALVSAAIEKSDGTQSALTVGNSDWTELSTGVFANSGNYSLLLSTSNTDTVGRLRICITISGYIDFIEMCIDIVANLESDTYARIGAPAGASISADIATINTSIGAGLATTCNNIYDRIGAPVGASISADIAGVQTTATNIYNRIGAPVGASISADIAGVQTSSTNIYNRIGAPAGASVSADIADVKGDTFSLAGGKWILDATAFTLTLYNEDDSPRYVFNTKDQNGNPSVTTVYQRIP